MIRGVVFDMDGTITRPVLDFAAIRKEVGAPSSGPPLLEYFETLSPQLRKSAFEVLLRHEREAAEKAEFNEGAKELLDYLEAESLPKALLTRNGDVTTARVLEKLGVEFDPVVTRDTGVGIKPSPQPLLYILEKWNLRPDQVMMVGDFLYDVVMGKRAGCRTAFVTNGKPAAPDMDSDIIITRMDELIEFLARDRSVK